MNRRMRGSEWITLIGLGVLVVGSIMPWFRVATQGRLNIPGASDALVQGAVTVSHPNMYDFTAPRLLGIFVMFWAACMIVAVLLGRTTAPSVLLSVPASWFGLALTVLIAVHIARPPDGGALRGGIYVAIAGAFLVWQGAWMSMRDDSAPPALDVHPDPIQVPLTEVDARAARAAPPPTTPGRVEPDPAEG